MGDVKSKGKLLLDAMSEADLDLWYMGDFEDPRRLQAAEKAATNYERAIAADLPADVEALLTKIEARGGAHRGEIAQLLGIIRKQAAERVKDAYTRIIELEVANEELGTANATLESAVRNALDLLGPEYFDDGKPLAELGRLVDIKGESKSEPLPDEAARITAEIAKLRKANAQS